MMLGIGLGLWNAALYNPVALCQEPIEKVRQAIGRRTLIVVDASGSRLVVAPYAYFASSRQFLFGDVLVADDNSDLSMGLQKINLEEVTKVEISNASFVPSEAGRLFLNDLEGLQSTVGFFETVDDFLEAHKPGG
ncbi:hypothetical protein GG681_12455 [Epibacterium sp. SM1969]|uniref:Uncharacterized protein n=1 Tax=Tritonibacter aquimaris TaxID=2663379 RepID=A0A844AMK3_9RHOB|nr:hypothetical protein [Tritonibacter aquimaris]MQY43455.1 hypothetical protein [Tritonibacter aquimaris]